MIWKRQRQRLKVILFLVAIVFGTSAGTLIHKYESGTHTPPGDNLVTHLDSTNLAILIFSLSGLIIIFLVYRQHQQTEDALRKSEERLQLLLGQAEFLLWATDSGLNFTQSLGGGLNRLGLQPNEVVEEGLNLYEFFQTDSPDFLPIKSHHEVLQGRNVKYDIQWQGRYYHCEVTPQKDLHDKIIGCIGIAVDISERMWVEQALQRSDVLELLAKGAALNDVLTALVVNAEVHIPEAICSVLLIDKDGKHLGIGSAPSLPDFYHKFIDKVEVDGGNVLCAAAAFTGERVVIEDLKAHPEWKISTALAEQAGLLACWAEPIFSVRGDVLGAFALYYRESRTPTQTELEYIQDSVRLAGIAIERKRDEEALSESEARYRLVVQQQTELICRFKPDFTLTFVNDAYCRYFGKSERELIGLDFFTLIPKEAWESAYQHFASFSPERSVQVQQHPVISPDGTQRWQQWTNQAFFSESGKLLEYQAVGTDITELKQAEEKTQKLLQQNRLLTQRLFQTQEEERRNLVRELHDEIGQWLTAIHLNARTMIERCKGRHDNFYQIAVSIEESVNHMHASIRNILYSLRPPMLDELGLEESLRELVEQWQDYYPGTECQITMTNGLDGLGEEINITAYRLVQEALNNIAKHAEATHVSIDVNLASNASVPDRLNIMIKDNGKGMGNEQRTNGYGLVGMRERVLAVDGRFNMDSKPGGGTCIEIQLPVNKPENA